MCTDGDNQKSLICVGFFRGAESPQYPVDIDEGYRCGICSDTP